jgi:hypothetical protein
VTTTVKGNDMAKPDPPRATEAALRKALEDALSNRDDIVCVHAGADPVVCADLLRRLLVEASIAPEPRITRFVLWNATIAGWLNLSGIELKFTPSFVQCSFVTGIDLTDATVVGFEMIGGTVPTVRADRLTASGSLLLRKALADPTYRHPQPAPQLAPIAITQQMLLCGAKIHGNVDLRGCALGSLAGEPICLLADGVRIEGNLLLSDGLQSTGEIRLNGCDIARNLCCSAATMTKLGGYSLSAVGGHVHGDLELNDGFRSTGAFCLNGATVDGDVDATKARFVATAFADWAPPVANPARDDLDALTAESMTVGGRLRLRCGFRARGVVNLITAHVGADFNCYQGHFDFPGEEALYADGITVDRATFLSETTSNGLLRFVQATLSQGCFIDHAVFERGGAYLDYLRDDNVSAPELGQRNVCGIYGPEAKIGGTFYFRDVTTDAPAGRTVLLSVQYATAGTITDSEASWNAMDRIDLRGCEYQTITDLTDAVDWRVVRLDRQYISPYAGAWRFCTAITALFCKNNARLRQARANFVPQPYMKLAQVVRAAGYEAAADRILVHLERNRTCFGGLGRTHQLARWTIDLFLRHGYAPLRPLLFLLAAVGLSTWRFDVAFHDGRLASSHANLVSVAIPGATPPSSLTEEIEFNPMVYAIDTLVPLVDLNQKKNFVFARPSCLLIFNSFFGWMMTTFLAAGVSGLAKRSGDE